MHHFIKIASYTLSIFFTLEFIARWIKYKRMPAQIAAGKAWRQISSKCRHYYQLFICKIRSLLQLSGLLTKTRDSCAAQSDTQTANGLKSFVTSLSKLPLNSFIECYTTHVYSCLGVGAPAEQEIAWTQLLSQYYEAKGDHRAKRYVQIAGEMASIELRQRTISGLIECIKTHPTTLLRRSLAELGFPFAFTPESMAQDIQIVINKERRYVVKIQELQAEFKEMDNGGVKGKATEEAFYETIAAMNEIWKTSLSVDRLNTLEYCIYCKRLEQYIENMNNKSR